jgi:hypothetical protein
MKQVRVRIFIQVVRTQTKVANFSSVYLGGQFGLVIPDWGTSKRFCELLPALTDTVNNPHGYEISELAIVDHDTKDNYRTGFFSCHRCLENPLQRLSTRSNGLPLLEIIRTNALIDALLYTAHIAYIPDKWD